MLKRLRDHELLVWDGEHHTYQISSAGRMALTALDQLLKFSQESDAELGFITAQIAAGAAVGRVSTEVLRHLLARLAELEEEFSRAVQSGSEFRLKSAQERLQSVWHWMEKGTEVMKNLGAEGLPDDASWRIAQEIGARQSRIMRMTGVFQRELSAIARQQVHLSKGGLSSGWQPWQMEAAQLANMPIRKPLTERDVACLQQLLQRPLPSELDALARWMHEHGEKGEQEVFL